MSNRQIDPSHRGVQRVLLIVGPILLAMGLILIAIGMVSFFMAFGGHGRPRFFWCAFLGMPFLFVGSVMCMFGLIGKVARYQAQEIAPVARDTFNYMAEGTSEGVETLAGAIGRGLNAGGAAIRCHKCNALMNADAKFCSECGQTAGKAKACPSAAS